MCKQTFSGHESDINAITVSLNPLINFLVIKLINDISVSVLNFTELNLYASNLNIKKKQEIICRKRKIYCFLYFAVFPQWVCLCDRI